MKHVRLRKTALWAVVAAAAAVIVTRPYSCHGAVAPPNNYRSHSWASSVIVPRRRRRQRWSGQTFAVLPNNCRIGRFSPTAPCKVSSILSVRGGASLVDDHDEESDDVMLATEEEEDDDDFLLDDDGDDNMFALGDDDDDSSYFTEDNTVDRMLEAWSKTPPFTKTYLLASVLATTYGFLFQRNHEFPEILSLDYQAVLTKLQIWRPVTAFLNFGPLGLGYLMTCHFVWTYMSTLERLHHDRPYDFWICLAFGQLTMVLGYPLLRLSPRFLGHNLSTFLVYLWSRYHEGLEVNMFELFNTRAELLPWFFLLQTALLEGEPPVLDFLGICFGHIYHYCKTIGVLRAPPALVTWYHSSAALPTRIRSWYKPISADFEVMP